MCGSFGNQTELKLIESFYPELFKRISKLEKLVAEKGRTRKIRERYCHWGKDRVGTQAVKAQKTLDEDPLWGCAECALN